MGLKISFNDLRSLSVNAGLDIVGITQASNLEKERDAFCSWQSKGFAGDMQYMKRDSALFVDPSRIMPNVKTIICFAIKYEQRAHPIRPSGFGRIARYAWGMDYHIVIRERLEGISVLLGELGIQSKVFTDAVPLLERPLAAGAGLGFIGKHSLLIRPKVGSLFLLGEILVDAEITEGTLNVIGSSCGACSNCQTNCPTQAIVSDRVVDARRCISYLSIEKKGMLEYEERRMLGEWVFGCDVCQDVCPFNHGTLKTSSDADIKELGSKYGVGPLVSLKTILTIKSDLEFKKMFSRTPLERPKRVGLIRNVCCVAVNTKEESVRDELMACVEDSSSVVRAMAFWAISELQRELGFLSGQRYKNLLDKVRCDDASEVKQEFYASVG